MLSYNLAPPVLEMNSADVKSSAGQQPTAVDKSRDGEDQGVAGGYGSHRERVCTN